MSHHTFTPISHYSFELGTQPQITCCHRLTSDTSLLMHTLCSHEDHAELIFVENGTSRCTIADRTYTVNSGDLILISCSTLHCLFPDGTDGLEAILVELNRLHLRGLGPNQLMNAQQSPIVATGTQESFFRNAFQMVDELAGLDHSEQITEAASHIIQAVLTILPELMKTPPSESPQQDYNLGLHIKAYIDEHYLEDLRLADIAAALHMNPYYLSHTFKRVLKCSPIQYMIRRRIGEAQNLLLSTDLTITEIAMRCGYNSANYFQVVFNNIVGMPPGKYRKTWH